MDEPTGPNWGNRIILLIFGALAIITIGGTILATMTEWEAEDLEEPAAIEAPATPQ